MIIPHAVIAGFCFAIFVGLAIISNGFGLTRVPAAATPSHAQQLQRMALLVGLLAGFGAGLALAAWLL